jgi:parallel beta helix pectate lyase-like protein
MPRLALVIGLLVVCAGCQEPNPASCELPANAGKGACPDAATSGGSCHDQTDCKTGNFPLCDNTTCVQCTAMDQTRCTGTTPICTSDVCTGCTRHADCPESNTCLPDGACALSTDVAYVDGTAGVDGAPCTKAMPCTKIQDAVAAKPIVKVSGTIKDRCSLNNIKGIKILANPDAKLEPMNNGVALEIKGDSNIEVYDLQISKEKDPAMPAVALTEMAALLFARVTVRDNPGNGISVTGGRLTCIGCLIASNGLRGIDASAGTTTVTQSTLIDNTSGGIRLTGPAAFHIVGNFIFRNGQPGKAAASGIAIQVDIQPQGAPPNELNFNSISRNAAVELAQGIQCSTGTPLTANNNIVWNNGSIGKMVQIDANGCTYRFSDIGPLPLVPDLTNMNTDPAFQNEASGELHLTKDSQVRHKADPSANLSGLAAKDIDGVMRTAPTDMGADEFRMP